MVATKRYGSGYMPLFYSGALPECYYGPGAGRDWLALTFVGATRYGGQRTPTAGKPANAGFGRLEWSMRLEGAK